jgi:NitT/TauT family transport system substrate-binding protein
VADAQGYFAQEGLTDYTLGQIDLPASTETAPAGAYQTYEAGREASVSCACHWTVNMAASNGLGRLWGSAYSISPCGIFVAPESSIRRIADLADIPIEVGYQSGSHYATIQALETAVSPEKIVLNYAGAPDQRLARLVAGESRAATLFGIQLAVAEQLGFRKIADLTFMIIGMVPEGVDPQDVARYYAALRRAQHDIDLHHQRYAHFYLKEVPAVYHDRIDVAAFGPGERIIFEPYSAEMYDVTHRWVEERHIFSTEKVGRADYSDAALNLA